MLHDRDLLRLTFLGDVPPERSTRCCACSRSIPPIDGPRAVPREIWATSGHPSIAVEQIDYDKLLAREEGDVPEPARRDELWRSIVMSMAGGQTAVFDERAQQRLLEIAGSPMDIADTAMAAMAPNVRAGRLADDHVAGSRGHRGIPPSDEHRLGDGAGPDARGDEQHGHGGHAARSARRDADDADRGRSDRRRAARARPGRGLRRQQSGAAAGDCARARRQSVGSARDHFQHHRARRRPQAPRAHHGAHHAERERLRQGRPDRAVSGAVGLHGRTARFVQRQAVRLGELSRRRSTASAAGPNGWRRPTTSPRTCPAGWRASARTTSAACPSPC